MISRRLCRSLAVATLCALLGLARAQDPDTADRWHRSLPDAQKSALQQRKPLIALLLDDRLASDSFSRSFDRDKDLAAVLDSFVVAKLVASKQPDLVQRFRIPSFPSIVFLTPGGRALKLMVGVTSTTRVRIEAKDALAKYERLLDPENWQPSKKRNPAPRQPDSVRPHVSSCPEKCEHCGPAIERAILWLTKRQAAGGNWPKPPEETENRTEDGRILTRSIDHIDTALTGAAGLALLTTGSAPGRGPHGAALARAKTYLQRAIREDGEITAKGPESVYHAHSIFETSLAAMFLAECLKLAPDAELASRLGCVSRGLAAAQDERSGGWGYAFDSKRMPAMDKTGWRLLATTHFALSALNALHDAGVPVDAAVRARGVKYLLSCVGEDGGFVYRSELRGMVGYPGATAGALYAIVRSGAPQPDLVRARRRFREEMTALDGYGEYWWTMLLFAALHSHDAGEGSWRAFRAHYRDVILANQADDGSFADPDRQGGSVLATSVAVFVLGLEAHAPPICGRRSQERDVEVVAKPAYLKPPDPLSRVKVFERDGRYLADLVVSVDGTADDAYIAHLADGLRGAGRILFDVTDGQMQLHRVTIHTSGAKADVADVIVTKRFYEDPDVPRGAPHGVTMVTRRTEIRNGKEVELPRIGQWVKLPFAFAGSDEPVPWHHWGLTRVIAHELCHYLLGVQDEYGVGGVFCSCFMGDLMTSELCGDADHSDDRRDGACWTQARRLYPRLVAPVARSAGSQEDEPGDPGPRGRSAGDPGPRERGATDPGPRERGGIDPGPRERGGIDPGPWDPPRPRVEIVK